MVLIDFLRPIAASQIERAFLIFLFSLIIFKITAVLIRFLFRKIAERTKTEIDDIIIKRWNWPINFLIFIASLSLAVKEITFTESVSKTIDHIIATAMTLIFAYLVYVVIDVTFIRVGKKITLRTETPIDDTLLHIAHTSLKAAFVVIAILYTLSTWGVEISPLLASLGIAGIAVALALQQTLSNVFAGISLIMDRTIRVGDIVKLETGEMGEIYSISLRSVRIKTFDNEMIIIPNSILANAKIQNLLLPDPTVRVNVDFSVEYGVDPEYVKRIVLEELSSMQIIDKTKEIRILFLEMGESSLNFRAMFWVDHIDKRWPAHQEAITKIYRRLYKEGIGIPFPQRTVWLRKDDSKAPNPFDDKFAATRDKIYPWFGHESEEKKIEEVKPIEKATLKEFLKKVKEKRKELAKKLKRRRK
jgi:MscS family membrane protein